MTDIAVPVAPRIIAKGVLRKVTGDTAVGEVANGIGAAIAGYLEDNPSLIADPAAAAAASRVPRFDVVLDFGADRTGATSAVPAVEAALAAANAAPGGIVFFPPGTYDLRAGLTTSITSSGVSIQGAGRTLTTLLVKSGSLFRWDGGPRDGGCSDMRIYCPTAPDTSSIILEVVTGTRQTFERLVVDNSYRILRCGIGTTHGCSQPTIVDVRGYTANVAGATAFDFVSGSVLTMRDVVVFANCGFPQNATDSHPAAAGTTGVRFGRGAWDTIVIQNLDLNRYDIDFDVTAVGGVGVSNAWLTDCVFDYAKTAAARFVTGGAGAGIRSWYVKGCWGVATDGHSWLVDSQVSATQIRHLHFTDCVGRQSGQNNWRFIGANSDGIEVLNCHGMGANRLAASNSGSAQDDLVILGGGVHVTGGWYGEDGAPYVGFTNQARYGVSVSPDLPSVSIIDVRAEGATGGFALSPNTSAGDSSARRRLVRGNRRRSGAAPEYASATTIAAPASAEVQTYRGSAMGILYLSGGVVTKITHNGPQVHNGTPATLMLHPGDTWSVTYTSAPTIVTVAAP